MIVGYQMLRTVGKNYCICIYRYDNEYGLSHQLFVLAKYISKVRGLLDY